MRMVLPVQTRDCNFSTKSLKSKAKKSQPKHPMKIWGGYSNDDTLWFVFKLSNDYSKIETFQNHFHFHQAKMTVYREDPLATSEVNIDIARKPGKEIGFNYVECKDYGVLVTDIVCQMPSCNFNIHEQLFHSTIFRWRAVLRPSTIVWWLAIW